jgi:hypothetical protein
MWIAERLLEEAERELSDPELIEQQLDDAEAAFARGELSEEDYLVLEEELVARLIGQMKGLDGYDA